MQGIKSNVIFRIKEKIKKDKITGCWNFTGGGIKQRGYGLIRRKGVMIRVHRYMYWYYNIKPLGTSWEEFSESCSDLEVCHCCDNPACCNPKHLFLGTRKDNARDCVNKGRYLCNLKPKRGTDNNKSVLTPKIVFEIYRMKGTQREIASLYGISQTSVYYIKSGRNWGWLTKGK